MQQNGEFLFFVQIFHAVCNVMSKSYKDLKHTVSDKFSEIE